MRNIYNINQDDAVSITGYPVQISPGATNGQVMKFQGGEIIWATDSSSTDALSIQGAPINNSPGNNQILVYKTAGNQILWENDPSGDATSINGIVINTTPPLDTQILIYNSGANEIQWGNDPSGDATSIHGVPIVNGVLINSMVLKYDSGTNDWVYAFENDDAVSIRGIDVSITPPTNNQILMYNSGANEIQWENETTGGNLAGGVAEIFAQKVGSTLEFKSFTLKDTNIDLTDDINHVMIGLLPDINISNSLTVSGPITTPDVVETNKITSEDGTDLIEMPLQTITPIAVQVQNLRANSMGNAYINIENEPINSSINNARTLRFNSQAIGSLDEEFYLQKNGGIDLELGIRDNQPPSMQERKFIINGDYNGSNFNNIFVVSNISGRITMGQMPTQWTSNNQPYVISCDNSGNLFATQTSTLLTDVQVVSPQENDYLRFDTSVLPLWKNEKIKFATFWSFQSAGIAVNNNFFLSSGMTATQGIAVRHVPATNAGISDIYTMDLLSINSVGIVPGAGNSCSCTLYKNGVATAVVATLSNLDTYTVSTNSITITPLDYFAIQFSQGTAGPIVLSVNIRAYVSRI